MGCVCVGNKMTINAKLDNSKLDRFKMIDKNWKKIIGYLSKKDIKEVSFINKYFHNLIYDFNYNNENKTEDVDYKNYINLKYGNDSNEETNEKLFLSSRNKENIIKVNFETEYKSNGENDFIEINHKEKYCLTPILINDNKKSNISKKENKLGTYLDIFTNMKIYVKPNNNNNFQSTISNSNSSLSYNGTPSFSEESRSIINSNISNINNNKFIQLSNNNNNIYLKKDNDIIYNKI